MSRILIAYATKTGSTARCADLLAAALEKAGRLHRRRGPI